LICIASVKPNNSRDVHQGFSHLPEGVVQFENTLKAKNYMVLLYDDLTDE
jgi:hypothetical protein